MIIIVLRGIVLIKIRNSSTVSESGNTRHIASLFALMLPTAAKFLRIFVNEISHGTVVGLNKLRRVSCVFERKV